MSVITFDKLAYLEALKAGGVPEAQARAHTAALDSALHDTVATKADIAGVKAEIVLLRAEMREQELRLTVRLGGMIVALGGILIAIKYFG